MLYLKNLWQKYISINSDIKDIADKLTLKTCEIEEIKSRRLPDTIVIGKVLEVSKHPDADKLFVTQIDCGKYGKFQIITGGENIVNGVGKYVPVALPDTYLPEIDLKIVPRKMRGLDSNGMICSKQEIGIPEDTDKHWIWLLNEDFEDLSDQDIGLSLKEKFPWLENDILDVDNKTLTHRPDLTGHFGLAAELNAIYSFDNKISFNKFMDYLKTFENTSIYETLQNSNKSERKVISQTEKLNTYILIQLDNISVKKSSFYLRTLLYDLGLNPKNNWVDFSNLFMYLSGQPIHFFDADKVKGDIIIRQAKNGEEFVDLFDNKYILSEEDIVIVDEEKILALAGVVGGKDSGVTENTKNILVEIANFDKVSVRKTGVRYGLRTDAELRFEKGINPLYSLYSLILFLDELNYFKKDLGNFEIIGLDWYSKQGYISNVLKPKDNILKNLSKFVLGEMDDDFIKLSENILKNLGFKLDQDQIIVPFWRAKEDINNVADLAEEVSRIYGYENIQVLPLKNEIKYIPFGDLVRLNRNLEEIFVKNFAFDQIETYPWVEEEILDLFNTDKTKLLTLKNPIAPQLSYLRPSIFFNFLQVVEKNFRFFDEIKIFDIGKIWIKKTDKYCNNYLCLNKDYYTDDWVEKNMFGFAMYKKTVKNWQEDLLLIAKGYIKKLFALLDLKGKLDYKFGIENIFDQTKFHPKKQGMIIFNGKIIGWIGVLHPIIYDYFKFPNSSQILFVELDMDKILEIISSQKKGLKQLKYEVLQDQIIYRDLSFLLPIENNYGDIVNAVKKVKGVEDVILFDIYKGENIPKGTKSISIKLKIKGENLTNEDINEILNKAIREVEKIGGGLRE